MQHAWQRSVCQLGNSRTVDGGVPAIPTTFTGSKSEVVSKDGEIDMMQFTGLSGLVFLECFVLFSLPFFNVR